jgi:hypothetical protein
MCSANNEHSSIQLVKLKCNKSKMEKDSLKFLIAVKFFIGNKCFEYNKNHI